MMVFTPVSTSALNGSSCQIPSGKGTCEGPFSRQKLIASWNKAQKRQAFVQVTKAHTAFQKTRGLFSSHGAVRCVGCHHPRADCVSVTS